MLECITELAVIFAKRLRRADMNDVIGALLKDNIRLAEPDRSQWRSSERRDL
jgi:hypothetical protein